MKIKSGYNFTLLLTDRGEVYSWGYNVVGQIGIGTIDYDYHKPTKIEFSLGIPIRYVSVGRFHAAAIDFDYNVYIWGRNNYGQLGLGDNHIAAINYDYNVYIWGRNVYGQLGLGYNVNTSSPIIIEYLTEKKIEKIYCRDSHTIALTQTGEVYSWGFNNNGNLGIENDNVNTPRKLNFPNNTVIKKLYVGIYHSYAIDTCSNIYSWGSNYNYQLCNSNTIHQNSPSIASMLNDFNVEKIICLDNSTIILADNKLYSTGYGSRGELGLGIKETREITLIKEGVKKVWGNWCTVFCKMINGDIYAWGFNMDGHLGIGNKLNQNIPVKLNMTLDIKSINYYEDVTYAITTNGEIYTWGKNILVNKELIMEPTLFTYFTDNNIEVKTINRTKSARKN